MNQHDQQQLDWIAFRYASGERDGQELADFELRLASDEAAQRALCQAVELGTVLSAALGTASLAGQPAATGGSARSGWRQSVQIGTAAMLAASLLVACLSWALLPGGPADFSLGRSEAPAEDPLQLAIIWTQARHIDWKAEPAEWVEPSGGDPEGPAAEDAEWSSSEVPSWLLAAVTAAEQETDEDPEDRGET